MKLNLSGVFLAMLLAVPAAHAQLYKWVGPDGQVTYSDAPPPKSTARVEQKNLSAGTSSQGTSTLPYELAQAVKNHPVILYAGLKCDPCDQGRALLKSRGIPFTEKSVTTTDDLARMKQHTDETRLPVLMVGRSKQAGFQDSAWNSALTAAGYPSTNRLPKYYRNADPQPAAPKAEGDPAAQADRSQPNATPAAAPSPATGNAPPGFRF